MVEIVEALEDQGLARDTYQLQDYVDPDALDQFIECINGNYTVTFTVDSYRVTITSDRITTKPNEDTGNETGTE